LMLKSVMFDPYILFVNFHVSCLNFHMHFAHIPNLNELKAKFTGNLGVLSPFAGLSRHICESLYIILLLCYTIGLSTYIYIFLSHLMLFLILYHYFILFHQKTVHLLLFLFVYIMMLPPFSSNMSLEFRSSMDWFHLASLRTGDGWRFAASAIRTVDRSKKRIWPWNLWISSDRNPYIYMYIYIYTYIYIYQIFTIHFGFDNEQCGFHNDFIWSNLW
jgi:hypothetical protein